MTEQLGIVLIYDEVIAFRVAPGGAQEILGITPDLTAFGKIVAGGLPGGIFGGRADVMELYDPTHDTRAIDHTGTFNANPLTLVAGEAVMRALTPAVYRRLADLGESLRGRSSAAALAEPAVPAQVTGVASLFGLHFTAAPGHRATAPCVAADAETSKRAVFIGLLNEGILLQTTCAGALGVMTTDAEIDTLVDAVGRVVRRLRE